MTGLLIYPVRSYRLARTDSAGAESARLPVNQRSRYPHEIQWTLRDMLGKAICFLARSPVAKVKRHTHRRCWSSAMWA